MELFLLSDKGFEWESCSCWLTTIFFLGFEYADLAGALFGNLTRVCRIWEGRSSKNQGVVEGWCVGALVPNVSAWNLGCNCPLKTPKRSKFSLQPDIELNSLPGG
jgi:hypothetical protein